MASDAQASPQEAAVAAPTDLQQQPSIDDMANSFYSHIAHGDEAHREWLHRETFKWFRGRAHLFARHAASELAGGAPIRMLTADECHELAETVGLGSVTVQRKFCEVNGLSLGVVGGGAPAVAYEARLRAVLDVVRRYLPPDGIHASAAMSEITSLVDPWPEGAAGAPADPGAMWDRFIAAYQEDGGYNRVVNLLGNVAKFRVKFIEANAASAGEPAPLPDSGNGGQQT
jgi:hypothetical protein